MRTCHLLLPVLRMNFFTYPPENSTHSLLFPASEGLFATQGWFFLLQQHLGIQRSFRGCTHTAPGVEGTQSRWMEWMEMDADEWKWMEWMEMDGLDGMDADGWDGWKWMEINGMDGNGWIGCKGIEWMDWMEMDGMDAAGYGEWR